MVTRAATYKRRTQTWLDHRTAHCTSRRNQEISPVRRALPDKDPDMNVVPRIQLLALIFLLLLLPAPTLPQAPRGAEIPSKWQISGIKVCLAPRGQLMPHIDVLGAFPVYSFFIPRPVWTVNGTVVDAQPVYQSGRLVSFTLLFSARLLISGQRNTVKFSLPDQNSAKTFHYDQTRPKPGECYEFF